MAVKLPIIDSEFIEEMQQLLDGANNHAAVVCGYLDGSLDDVDLNILRAHSSKIRSFLSGLTRSIGRMHYVSTFENGEISSRIPSQG